LVVTVVAELEIQRGDVGAGLVESGVPQVYCVGEATRVVGQVPLGRKGCRKTGFVLPALTRIVRIRVGYGRKRVLLRRVALGQRYDDRAMKPVDRIASAAEGRLGYIVPSCPGWQLADLVWHVGVVHMFWQKVARGELSGPDAWREPVRPADNDLLAWYRSSVDMTATVLDSLDVDTPAWTWGRQNTVGFIRRRVAQESAVHCWDATNAIGADEPIAQTLAVDGVDEFVDEVLPGLSPDLGGPAHTICLRPDDSTDQWTVQIGEGSARLIPACRQVDVTVRAPISDLLLFLWRRRSPHQVHVEGNMAALQRFLQRVEF